MDLDVEIPVANGFTPSQPRYRSAIPLPDAVRNHCHVLIDEKLYGNALSLLQDLIAPGAANPDPTSRPIIAPLPLHIEIASALLIHPRFTNQAAPSDYPGLSAKCITFLRNVLAILGPINANLGEAFSFDTLSTSRTLRRSRNRADLEEDSSSSDGGDGYDHPGVVIANSGRIRRNAKDFWHVVGWAFNCSVKYPQRWKCWKLWLGYMLDVLDADWFEREEQDQHSQKIEAELGAGPVDGCDYKLCRESLLVQYLSEVKGRSSGMKRVIRSIFTDGGPESINEFPEVWANETRVRKPPAAGQKRKRDFGDCDDEDAPTSSDTEWTPELYQDSDEDSGPSFEDPWIGGPESIVLRQRVLVLLSRMAAYFPDEFGNIRDVYEAIYSNVKPLPILAFTLFFAPSKSSPLPPLVFVSLTQLLLLRLLPMNAPQPHTISDRDNDSLNQDIIVRCFLPFPANTSSVVDNAKLSILVENVFRFFLKACPSYHTPSLDTAVEKGILARENKAKGDRRKKDHGATKKEDEEAWEALKASGERLRTLQAWMKENSQEEYGVRYNKLGGANLKV